MTTKTPASEPIGTPWGTLKETVEMQNGVILGLVAGGGVIALTPNNPEKAGRMKVIDDALAILWFFRSLTGAHEAEHQQREKNLAEQAERYGLEQEELERIKREAPHTLGVDVTMEDGTLARLTPIK